MPSPSNWPPTEVPIADARTGNRVPPPWILFFQRLLTQAATAVTTSSSGGAGTPGSVPVFDSAGNLDSVPPGPATYVLTSTGPTTAPTWQPPAGGGAQWSVLTNGNVASPQLIFAGGDVIMLTW